MFKKPIKDGLFTWSQEPVMNFKKGLHRHSKFNDPTFLGFVFLFDWYTPDLKNSNLGSPLLAGTYDLTNPEYKDINTKENTALAYLESIGDDVRINYLKNFQQTLYDINYHMPWYWQSIEGLEGTMSGRQWKDPYVGGEDAELKISTLESIDLKIASLMQLYSAAMYDTKYRRVIVPENLRKFGLTIYIKEIRKFRQIKSGLISQGIDAAYTLAGNNVESGEYKDVTNENGAEIIIHLRSCEFLPGKSATTFFSNFSNSAPEEAANELCISYEDFEIHSNFPDVMGNVGENNFSVDKLKEDWAQKLKDGLMEKGSQLTESAARDLMEKAKGYANKLILGNVYGISPTNITNALNQGSIQGISQEIGRHVNSKGGNISGKDNVYGDVRPKSNNISGRQNINNDVPDSSGKLTGKENIHKNE